MEEFDLIVIGWGKGGKTLAAQAAEKKWRVAVVERSERMYGGTCINTGCLPSKYLVAGASRIRCLCSKTAEARADAYRETIEGKRRMVESLRSLMYEKLRRYPNVRIFNGEAGFLPDRRVMVTAADGGETVIGGPAVVIDTGSVPAVPAIDGAADNPFVFTSEGILELDRLPERVVIVGGGYIGLEFAFIYAGFGSRVTVIQDGDTFLPREDDDVSLGIAGAMKARGIELITGAKVSAIRWSVMTFRDSGGNGRTLEADAFLLATGRRPDTAALRAAEAGLELTPRGGIKTDEYLRTAAPGVWAIGDVRGEQMFTYISLDDSRIVRSQLFEKQLGRSLKDRKNIPYSVFMDPPFARIGLNEREAAAAGHDFKVGKLPIAAIAKARVFGETDGFMKALIDSSTGLILGAALWCPEAHELVNLIGLAMDAGMPHTVLRDRIFNHPTMSEAFNDLFA